MPDTPRRTGRSWVTRFRELPSPDLLGPVTDRVRPDETSSRESPSLNLQTLYDLRVAERKSGHAIKALPTLKKALHA